MSDAVVTGAVADSALDAVREEVRAWLKAADLDSLPRREAMAAVVDAGWAVPTWPQEWWGRGWDAARARAATNEFASAGAPGAGQDYTNLAANTVLAFGDDALRHKVLRPLLTGDLGACLLYSEPGAGSDLASVQTTARRDGDEWVVTGQKVWTSGAHHADVGMLIARTDWDAPKHGGLTFFLLPMRQPGVEVRPIRQITGERHFNEVFISDARVPDGHRVGDVGMGWRVLQTALAYERALMGTDDRAPRRAADGVARDDPIWGGSADLVALAVRRRATADPVVREELMSTYTLRMLNRWNGLRAAAALERGTSSSLPSIQKLLMSRIVHRSARLHAQLIGADALLAGTDHPIGDAANFEALNAFFTSIGGGTDQIQKNIVGERLLGLPKEADVDRTIPFSAVLRAATTVDRPEERS